MGETNTLSVDDAGFDNGIYAQSANLASAGTVQSLSFDVTQVSGTLGLGIYDATGPSGGPGKKLAETAQFTPTVGWNTAAVLTPVNLAAGTYWLAYWTSSGSMHFVKQDNVGSASYYQYTNSTMPATWSTSPWTASVHWSLYATLSSGQTTTFTPNVVRTDINNTYGITGTHGYSYAVPTALNDGAAHTVNIFLNDTSGGPNTNITNGGVQMMCGSSAPTATISGTGCTLAAGSCPVYVTWKALNTNAGLVDLLQTAPDGTQVQITGQPSATTTLTRTANQSGTYTFGVYNYNKGYVASSFLGKINLKVNPSPVLNCNAAAQDCSMNAGKSVQVNWSCAPIASDSSSTGGNFSTGGALTGSSILSPTNTTTYTLQCNPSSSAVSRTIMVLYPSLSLKITPNLVRSGNAIIISWVAQNADSCTLSGPGVSLNSLVGTTTTRVSAQSRYTLSCKTGIGTQTVSKLVNLVPVQKEQ